MSMALSVSPFLYFFAPKELKKRLRKAFVSLPLIEIHAALLKAALRLLNWQNLFIAGTAPSTNVKLVASWCI